VQGRLREEPLSVAVNTECAHCAQPLHIDIDSELNYHIKEEGADPRVFMPLVDFTKVTEPSITDVF
jgi:hypothetical protein